MPITAKDALTVAREQNILLQYWGGRRELSAQQRIGTALGRRRDRIFGTFRIRSANIGATGGNAYRLEKIGVRNTTPETPETPEVIAEEADFGKEFYNLASQNSDEDSGNQGSSPEVRFRNSPLSTDSDSVVSGVSGVISGGPVEEVLDVWEVD